MRRILLAGALGVVAGCAGAVFAMTLSGALFAAPSDLAAPAAVARAEGVPPARIAIPAIGVDAAVQAVGVTAAGNLGVPDNFHDAGWYAGGPAPGEPGNAVIDGHVNNGLALPGVFSRLHEIGQGAIIEISGQDGSVTRFAVTEVKRYPYRAAPEGLYRRGGQAGLVLITCGGTWLPQERTYDERVVVFASIVR